MSEDISFAVHGLNPDNSVKLGSDAQLAVQFYRRAVLNDAKSRETGTPQYEPKDYIKIFHPGEKDMIDRPVKELDKRRFGQQWMAYQQNREQVEAGTPLEHLFPGNPEVVATLRAHRIQTVQQLANISDSSASGIQFGGDLRKKAQTFLEGAEKAKGYHALEKVVQDQAAMIKSLQEQITAMAAETDDEDKPRRGRPPKAA